MATLCYTVHKQHWAMAKAIQEDTREYNFEARQWLQDVLLSTSYTGQQHKLHWAQATSYSSGQVRRAPSFRSVCQRTVHLTTAHKHNLETTFEHSWSHKFKLLIFQMYTSDPPTAHNHILYTTFEHCWKCCTFSIYSIQDISHQNFERGKWSHKCREAKSNPHKCTLKSTLDLSTTQHWSQNYTTHPVDLAVAVL